MESTIPLEAAPYVTQLSFYGLKRISRRLSKINFGFRIIVLILKLKEIFWRISPSIFFIIFNINLNKSFRNYYFFQHLMPTLSKKNILYNKVFSLKLKLMFVLLLQSLCKYVYVRI